MEETSKGNGDCLTEDHSDCDKGDALIETADDSNNDGWIKVAVDAENNSPSDCNEQGQYSKPSQGQWNKMKISGQKRRQRAVNRLPGVPLHSLFSLPVVQDNFDLRDVLGRQHDESAWWHQRPQQNNFQQLAKKLRTDNPNWKRKNHLISTANKVEEPIEDITNPLKCVIVSCDYPRILFNNDHYLEIQTLLTNEMVKITEENLMPRFWSCFLKHGSVLIVSADEKSKDWLIDTVANLTLTSDIKLKVGLAKDILLTIKVSLPIPKLFKDLEQDKVLRLIKLQNTGLRADFWQILECKEDDKGRLFHFAIDEESFEVIKNSNYKIHFGVGIIKFTDARYYNVSIHPPTNS